ncbi:hypothetical protein CLOSTASPAR_00021 [[Clostridium] asparagiforme DSM 15981]|uniref:Uncharacterized protein n=1 Tax=[Clostridium] asparagiforme DSM 15981 TaxID=518636 RepID=C0CSS7_9FIRM|nr:hypothetical protein CLOSTASPAR_00021 [[Clostridium] asparagiforme DSM 15981]
MPHGVIPDARVSPCDKRCRRAVPAAGLSLQSSGTRKRAPLPGKAVSAVGNGGSSARPYGAL